jgi:hypothetical protein
VRSRQVRHYSLNFVRGKEDHAGGHGMVALVGVLMTLTVGLGTALLAATRRF